MCEVCYKAGLSYEEVQKGIEYFNGCHEDVVVFGTSYEAGRVFHELDPIAFRCAMADENLLDDDEEGEE